MRYYVFKKLKSTVLFIICIETVFCSIGIISVAKPINNITIENMIDDKINSNQCLTLEIWRFFMFGPIYNLTITGNDYDFESNSLWGLAIFRSWGPSEWAFQRWIFHDKVHVIWGIDDFNFYGIIKPNFICGCFSLTFFG